jgi:NitT/TauT family transport system substrate-binding protein
MRLDPPGVPLLNRSRHVFRGRYLLAGICGLSVLAAAGCGSPGSAGTTVSSTVTIAAVPGVDDAGIYLAQKDGLFAAEGLTSVRIVPYKNQAAVLSALQNGQADIAASDYGDIFYKQATQRAAGLRILADGYDATAGVLDVLTLPGKNPMSPADLANAKVGLPNDDNLPLPTGTSAPTSLDAAAAADVLSNYVGKAAADLVQWKPMPQSEEIKALKQRTVQAILVSEPYIYKAESIDGAVEVIDACSGDTAGLPLLGYVAMNAWVRDNPAAAADFQAALAKAQAEAAVTGKVQGVLPSLPSLPGATRINTTTADLMTIGAYPTSTSVANLQAVVRLMGNWGMINESDTRVQAATAIPPMIVRPGS